MAAKKTEDREIQGHRHTAAGILLIASAIYILFCTVSSTTSPKWTGLLGIYLVKWLLEKTFGFGIVFLPLFLTLIGAVMLTRQEPRSLKVRITGFCLLFMTFITTSQFFFPKYYLKVHEIVAGGGGWAGYFTNYVFIRLLGSVGTVIILSAMLIISLVLIFNITTIDAFLDIVDMIRSKKNDMKKKPRRVNQDVPIIDHASYGEDKSSIQAQLPLIKEMRTREDSAEPRQEEKIDLGTAAERPVKKYKRHSYKLPSLELLNTMTEKEKQRAQKLRELMQQRKTDLERVLRSFGVGANVMNISIGPAVTRFEVQPEPGVKVSKIANLADDIALNLASGGVRMEAPILGKSVVGIEVPNMTVTPVHLGEIARTNEFAQNTSKLLIGIGKDIAGAPIFGDLSKMPHLLIAGTTGSGKSVAINSLIVSILLRARPDEVKFIMIDPKMVELTNYSNIPHLMAPVVTDPKKAAVTLKEWVVREMERRYKEFFNAGVRNIDGFNKKVDRYEESGKEDEFIPERLPYIVVIIDELADLMMVAASEVETTICRIAQMARATGIHLVVATQRPSVDVITGLIKANIPSRISFAVATQIDSRVILDMSGAEKLLGRGDMLYSPIGAMKPTRVQGSFVSDDEIERIVSFVRDQASPEYSEEILNLKFNGERSSGQAGAAERDELFAEAARIIIESGQGSTSHLQRRMRIGYNRAARLMDELTDAGVVSQPEGENRPRKILKSMSDLISMGMVDSEAKPDYPKF
ncbi:MAG: DNA translocase FtsK 4TM domain-containing protein [Candidatus Saganbacteria bacterium]|nr:DNA translocase FtsK 4TM domain-containing protein [Candidatus Saganbacteria bacterium]